MPLMIEGGRVPPRWAEQRRPGTPAASKHLKLALINNMPDAALEDTELQFFALLDDASADLPVYLKLYSLSGIPRTDRGQRHLNSFYSGLEQLWQDQLDGVIITGTEPRQPNLREEPYWRVLAEVFDWAERHTISTILSCLAAHAGVLHSDGIPRHPLGDKQFGVFTFDKAAVHPLMVDTGDRIRFPHSRWNEVRAEELADCGYSLLTQSAEGGVDSFVKKKKQSLFLHFQGHPEYGAETLLKEYRRDIRRFLRRERETFPTRPKGYFDPAGEKLVGDFQQSVLTRAVSERHEELMQGFPDSALAAALERTWRASATTIYRNWLGYLAATKEDRSRRSSSVSVSLSPASALPSVPTVRPISASRRRPSAAPSASEEREVRPQ